MQSGSKLVLGIFGLALLAGILSWWYRFESAHRSTTFWGPHFAELIARPSEVTAFRLQKEPTTESGTDSIVILGENFQRYDLKDLTAAPGMVHLRNSILSDGNYDWDAPVNTDDWRWCLQFETRGRQATLLFTENFKILGRMNQRANDVRTVDCSPMAGTLRQYFTSIGIFPAAEPATDASNKAD
jgi:hypothetical protein